jgi:hypothetical protein
MKPTTSYWSSRSWVWVIRLSLVLILAACAYGRLHHVDSWLGPGKERITLAQADIDLARRILTAPDSSGKPILLGVPLSTDTATANALFDYLGARLAKWESTDRIEKISLMKQLRGEELLGFLGTAHFEVRSFFWLTGWPSILEVVFWTLFGTLCSLLYNIYDVRRQYALDNPCGNDDPEMGFDPREMPNHLAKLVFSPFVSVIVIFGYKYLAEDGGEGIIETSTGVVLMSFLLGFYSARAMRMLDRIKDVLLPYDAPARGAEIKPKVIADVAIELKLSPAIAQAHKVDLEELLAELDGATVSLAPEGGGDIFRATAVGEDNEPRFTAKVPAGRYTVTARKNGGAGVNLVGTIDADITGAARLEIIMEEDEASG